MRVPAALMVRVRRGAGALVAMGVVACAGAPSDPGSSSVATNATLASSGGDTSTSTSGSTSDSSSDPTSDSTSTASTTNVSYPEPTESYPPPCGRG